MTRQGLLWALAALLGIVVAAVIAWSAGQLAGQRIGLASAPVSVASGLAPPPPLPPHPRPRRRAPAAPPAASTSLIPTLPRRAAPATSPAAAAAQSNPQTGNSPAPTQREDPGHRSAGGSSDGQPDD